MTRNSSSTKSRANSSGVRLGPVPPPPPAPVKTKQYEIHPAQPSHSGPGFLGSVVQGFGLGMGSSLGHRATDAIFGEKKTEPPPATVQLVSSLPPTGSCEKLLQKYSDCMSSDYLHCDKIYDEYFVCIQPK